MRVWQRWVRALACRAAASLPCEPGRCRGGHDRDEGQVLAGGRAQCPTRRLPASASALFASRRSLSLSRSLEVIAMSGGTSSQPVKVRPLPLRRSPTKVPRPADQQGGAPRALSSHTQSTPLVCAGCAPTSIKTPAGATDPPIPPCSHTRPVPSIHYSPLLPPTAAAPNDPNYLLISSCKDGKPMLRDWCVHPRLSPANDHE